VNRRLVIVVLVAVALALIAGAWPSWRFEAQKWLDYTVSIYSSGNVEEPAA
jgi:hypothetical protein